MSDIDDVLLARMDRLAADEMAVRGVPGVAVALTDRDGDAVVRTYGLANVDGALPVAADTLFEIGSIGKVFTAIVVLQLAEEGRLDLHAPVAAALPWFAMPVVGRPVTLHDLLTHTAGITSGIDGTPEAAFQVHALRHRTPGSAPGERYRYSNVGFKILGLVIEAIEGLPYPDVVRRRVLEPLGMTQTEPAITNAIRPRLAVGYAYEADDRIGHLGHPLAPATWLETATADGSIASTASDMAILARMLLRRGEGPRGRLLSEASFARMAGPHIRPSPDFGYGYGLMTRVLNGRTFIGHTGGMIGFVAGLQVEGHRVEARHHVLVEHVEAAVALGEAPAGMGATEHLDRAAVGRGGVERDHRGGEALGEARPRDEVLVERVADGAGRLEDQFVLHEHGGVGKQVAQKREQRRGLGYRAAGRGDVDDRVEQLEERGVGVEVPGPADAEVAAVDELRVLREGVGLAHGGGQGAPIDEGALDVETVPEVRVPCR